MFLLPAPEHVPYLCRYLESCRRRYDEEGDRAALLDALAAWLTWCIGPPDWIVKGFYAAWAQWCSFEAPTLDAAFGVQRPLGKHLWKRREQEVLRPIIVFEVEMLRQQGMSLDIRLFSVVGAEINKSAGYVSKVYYDKASAGLRLFAQHTRITRVAAAE